MPGLKQKFASFLVISGDIVARELKPAESRVSLVGQVEAGTGAASSYVVIETVRMHGGLAAFVRCDNLGTPPPRIASSHRSHTVGHYSPYYSKTLNPAKGDI